VPRVRLQRDRLTLLVYAHLAVYGYFLYGMGPAVPLLRHDEGVSRAIGGLHGTALAAGAVLAGLTGAWLTARWGRGGVLRGGLLTLAVGIVLIVSTRSLPMTLLGALVAGTAGSFVVNAHAAVLTDHHQHAGPAAISEANALAAGLGALAPAVLGGFQILGPGWRFGMLVGAVGAIAVTIIGWRVDVPAPAPPNAVARRDAEQAPGKTLPLPRRYWVAWTVLVLCIAVEFSMTIWASDLLRQRLHLSSGAAAACITAIPAGMTAGRVIGSRLALGRDVEMLLLGSLAVTATGFAFFWAVPVTAVAVAGLFVVGLGIAMQYPLSISRLIARSQGRADLATARASLGAGIAVGGGPFVLGWLADSFGTHRAFLLVPAMLGTAALLLLMASVAGRVSTRLAAG
jgi:predicted MFS family arabinose efflux permease